MLVLLDSGSKDFESANIRAFLLIADLHELWDGIQILSTSPATYN